ncbi:AfsR/SARP family transcriptional regulator [Pseudonocardia spinosispora]|uniref:AfsR/SARP family transcriptional regulator n=1 Tax=Pseudonocardia spinosispora TaxID=103441 RepID=UPI0004088696|nr:BTAD domain-containing putative transcriptional regulator [Pseudonocardia spinosispora]
MIDTAGIDTAGTPDRPRYRVLGLITAHGSDGEPQPLAPKSRAVLAALLLRANLVVADEQLLDSVWGAKQGDGAKHRLYNYVSELRSRLGAGVITRAGAGYLITVAPGELDLQVFTDAVTEARTELRDGKHPDAAGRLRSALALWTGPALSGATKPMIAHERPALEERRLTAFEELFEAELAAGRHGQIVDELGKIASEHPLRERLAAALMLALDRCERRIEALTVYTETRRRLVGELGMEPGPQLREMQRRILDADEPPIAQDRAQHVQRVRPTELPRDVRGFAGRTGALTMLDERLTTADGGVCVVSGIGGVGKTALALHWAHAARGHFPDGQLYLNLRGHELDQEPLSPLAALSSLLQSLGVSPRRVPATVADCESLYRCLLSDRTMLLVLDNARDEAQVLPLLPPTGSLVVTSRNRLAGLVAHAGAHLVPLGALTEGESQDLLSGMLGPDRIAAEHVSAARLVELCAGLPLALRIAGANIAVNTAADPDTAISTVAAELAGEDRLAALTVEGAEDSPVVTAFCVSHRALGPEQQRLFQLLGLIPGADFTEGVAAALGDLPGTEATRLLKGLASACIVEKHTDGRYRFHDLIRLFAASRVREDPDGPAAWNRLVDYHLCAATVATRGYGQSTVQLRRPDHPLPEAWRTELEERGGADAELANMTAVALRAVEQGPYPAAWLLVAHLRTYHHRTGRRAEWLRIAQDFLDAARKHGEVDVQALLHLSIGTSIFQNGWPEAGLVHMRDAIRLSRECGWPECEAAALADLGVALSWTSRAEEALEPARRAVTLFAELCSPAGENRAWKNLNELLHFLGRLEEAEECCRAAMALSEKHGLRAALAGDLMLLGSLRISGNRLAEAEELFGRARQMFTELRSASGLAFINARLSQLYWQRGDFERSRVEAEAALAYSLKSDAPLFEATGRTVLANAQIGLGEYARAEENLDTVMRIVEGQANDLGWHRAKALAAKASLAVRRGDPSSGVEVAQRARRAARDGGYLLVEATALVVLVEAHLGAGDLTSATTVSRDALDMADRSGLAILEHDLRHVHERYGAHLAR